MISIQNTVSYLYSKRQKIAKFIIFILLFLAISIGFFTRIYSVFQYDQFGGDQARDAFVYAKMRQGEWPLLGPGSSVGGYALPPLYYYLNFIVSFGSLDPAMQAFPNALFSFLSIPLLAYFILLLLNGFKSHRAWLVASFGALWWSLFFNDIVLNNLEWNPNSVPFFLLMLLVLIAKVSEPNLKLAKKIIIWSVLGLAVSILMSLHSSALFVVPAVFTIFVLIYLIKNRRIKSSWFSLLSFVMIFIMHLSYLYGEFGRGFENTKNIISTVTQSSAGGYTFFERFDRSLFNYLELGNLAYFAAKNMGTIAHFFLSVVLGLAVVKFKGNKTLWAFLWGIWLVFSYAASSFWGTFYIHYKILIWFAPIVFTAVYLQYFNFKNIKQVILAAVVLILSLHSISINYNTTVMYLDGKYGSQRLALTSDISELLKTLPESSRLCTSNDYELSYKYIASVSNPKNVSITQICEDSDIKIYYRYLRQGDFKLIKNNSNVNINQKYFENEAILVYS